MCSIVFQSTNQTCSVFSNRLFSLSPAQIQVFQLMAKALFINRPLLVYSSMKSMKTVTSEIFVGLNRAKNTNKAGRKLAIEHFRLHGKST